jgi:hypothetical protein
MKTVKIKGKEYVEVHQRILHLAENHDYEIQTDYEFLPDLKMWVCRAILTIYPSDLGGKRVFTGLAQEIIGDGYINKTSALENAETSAVGRACAMAGIGIVDGIASVDEINKAENRTKKKDLKENTEDYTNVVKALANGYKIEDVKKKYKLSADMEAKLMEV